ncbi:hypothetical protein MOB72_08090 [Bacillus licheniformis]|uniref:hypothetical protein n=1 Tax=Bacillus TaxID=1386 RepID=UPI00227ED8A7|nr:MULTISPECIES: hypothetical protein [Bacillus]MCY7954712.1 hypothetical protein [Bacillus licheniformis]MCY8754767.1 hypothetical protein [Bacillus haynesii]
MCLKDLKQKQLWITTALTQPYKFVLNAGVMRLFMKKFNQSIKRKEGVNMDIYKEGARLGLDKPLSNEERSDIEGLLRYHNKHSSVHRALLRLLCAERKDNEGDDENHAD